MTLFFTITLCTSAVGLLMILGLKRYELKTGKVLFVSARPAFRSVMHTIVLFVQYLLPFLARRSFVKAVSAARKATTRAIARAVIYIETSLSRALHSLERGLQPPRGGVASSFLQEVAEHKRRLLHSPAQRQAIIEEFNQ